MLNIFLSLTLFVFASNTFDHSYEDWNNFLNTHVKVEGPVSTVNYSAIKKNPGSLNKILNKFSTVTKNQYDNFDADQRLAFLINAYNAFTIKLIVDNYPVKSIKDIGSFSFSNLTASPWKKEFFNLLEQKRHLDNVEHDMIREWFKEPRIHFAVVCASIGCPKLQDQAYTGENLNELLETAAKEFLNDKSRNRFENGTLKLSSIFKWYGNDFKNGVKTFVAPYMSEDKEVQKKIINADLEYLTYDWNLNEHK